jgi:CRP-like cAMP-binding protein
MAAKSQLTLKAQEQALLGHLLQVPLFHRLSGRQVQFFVKTAERRELSAGTVLCWGGEECRSFYILVRGNLRLGEKCIAAPNTIGAATLLSGAVIEADIIAAEPSLVLEVARRYFTLVMTRNPAMCQRICRNLIGIMAGQLQEANDNTGEIQERRDRIEADVHDAEMELNDLRMLRSYR